MGGDLSPEILVQAIKKLPSLLPPNSRIILLCSEEYAPFCADLSVDLFTSTQVILPNDSPLEAVRKKQDSSLVQGIKLLAAKSVDALISPGNTGALFAAATIYLKKLPNVHRPALLSILPTESTPLGVIDVGGRISVDAEGLLRCAYLGAQTMRALFDIPLPRVGLLNIGEESVKGTSELKLAYQKFQEASGQEWIFKGNIEGRAVFSGQIDVLVTDGFTGNILLKVAEGITQFVLHEVEPLVKEADFSRLKSRLDYREYPGAILCGVEGLVVKCHGNTGPEGIIKAVLEAVRMLSI